MAGIDTLFKGAVGSLAKDKVTNSLTPTQMELASFILNPQYYIAEKGVNKIAEILGYGGNYQELKGGAQDEKAYYKQVMRDALGDVLPESIGNFVRATPRNTEVDNTPAGTYTAWNPDTQSFEEQQSSVPAVSFDQFSGDRFAAANDLNSAYNTNSQNYVGPANPKDMNSSIYASNLTNLLEMLGPYESATPDATNDDGTINTDSTAFMGPQLESSQLSENNAYDFGNSLSDYLSDSNTDNTGGGNTGANALSYTQMIDILNSSPSYGGGNSMNESFGGGFGGGSGKGLDTYDMAEYKRGGQIRKGRR